MSKLKNVVEKAESMIGKIPAGYELNTAQVAELYEKSPDWFHLIGNSFRFGYLQGMRAAKAEAKRGGVRA